MGVRSVPAGTRTVGDPTIAFESMKPLWDKARAVCGGERFVKEYDAFVDTRSFTNLLIPFSPTMSQEQYSFFKAEAELPGITSAFAKMLIGGLLRKPPEIRFDESVRVPEEAITWIRDNFGADGSPILSFLAATLWEEVQTSRAWVGLNVGTPEKDEDNPEIIPFPIWLRADVVINHRVAHDPATGKTQLKFLVVRGFIEDYGDENSDEIEAFHPKLIEAVWVHRLSSAGYIIEEYRAQSETTVEYQNGHKVDAPEKRPTTFKLHGEPQPGVIVKDEMIDFIPFWPFNGEYDFSEPLLTSIIDKEIALYNKVSRRNHLLYGAATYTPVVFSDMAEDDFDKIVESGLGTWIKLGENDKADILKTPTEALADMDRAIEASIEELAKLGVRMLSPETAQSGVALQLRNAAQTAQLASLCTKISATIRQLIAQMLNWRYNLELKDSDVIFNLSSDFDSAAMGHEWLRLVTEWYQDGIIPRSVWMSILKKNDMVPADYDDEAGKTEIGTDPLIKKEEESGSGFD
jgi:hypothetical protein